MPQDLSDDQSTLVQVMVDLLPSGNEQLPENIDKALWRPTVSFRHTELKQLK